jgi:hypothetical protein
MCQLKIGPPRIDEVLDTAFPIKKVECRIEFGKIPKEELWNKNVLEKHGINAIDHGINLF